MLQNDVLDPWLFEPEPLDPGRHVDQVAQCFAAVAPTCWNPRRWCGQLVALPTASVLRWVAIGRGVRGALLATDGSRLHPQVRLGVRHAVAVTWLEDRQRLALIDICAPGRRRPLDLPVRLARAHARARHRAILVYAA